MGSSSMQRIKGFARMARNALNDTLDKVDEPLGQRSKADEKGVVSAPRFP